IGRGRPRARLHLRHAGRTDRHHDPAGRCQARRHPLPRPAHHAELAGGHLRRPGQPAPMSRPMSLSMNVHAIRAIYHYEMARWGRTVIQSVVSPVISTSLYFVVFGAAIGARITEIEGVSYGAFIVPGLIMLMLLTQ